MIQMLNLFARPIKYIVITISCTCLLYGCGSIRFNAQVKPKSQSNTIKMVQNIPHKNFALVLGGGGAKGFAHVGVLEELHNAGLEPDIIIGCSAGAIVGALYAADPDIEKLKASTLQGKSGDIVTVSLENWPYSVYTSKQMHRFLSNNLAVATFEELKVPFVATATDLQYGVITTFSDGALSPAIIASAAYPGVFSPIRIEDNYYIDCGVADPLPTSIARDLGFKHVVAVNIAEGLPDSAPNHGLGVMKRGIEIAYINLINKSLSQADIVIDFDFKNIDLLDDQQNVHLYEQGKARARDKIPVIKQLITKK